MASVIEQQYGGEPDESPAPAKVFPGPPSNEIIGDYELLEVIGRGGMGLVWRARQRSNQRIVALKMIRTGEFADLEEIRRFRNESKAVALLDHPNIVPIYEIGEDAGRHYFSMQLVEGGSLAAGAAARGRAANSSAVNTAALSRDAATLVAKVAHAVHFAHQHGLLHRDLKPANILLDANGEPLVADFGLARFLGVESSLTGTGYALGSPSFMAPEQATGKPGAATTAADIYSLGAILFHLLTGRAPFQGATPLEILRQVVESEPPPPSSLNSHIAPDLETICLKCLAKDPAQRYPSAGALAEDLERWLRREPILARPASVRERLWKWTRRHPAAAVALALALAGPALTIAVLLLMGARVTRERDNAQHQAEITRQNLYAADLELAYQALEANDYAVAWRSLAAHRPGPVSPARNGDATTDLRGFEWRWLWQRAQGDARANITAHFAQVRAVAYSPDGRFAASACLDGTTKLWDAAQEKLLRTFDSSGHPSLRRTYTDQESELHRTRRTLSVSFSADSHTLLTGSITNLCLWELNSGRRLWSLNTNKYSLGICSPTDPNLALVMPDYPRTSLGLLNLASQRVTAVFTNGRNDTVCFSPDGQRFARWDREQKRIWLQEIPSGRILASFDSSGIYVLEMAFTPDGRTLAACSMEKGRVDLFQQGVDRPVRQLEGHDGRAEALAISPDGGLLASAGFDQTIRLWNLATFQEVRQLHGHRSGIRALAFSPDGQRLLSGGHDGTVRFWDLHPPAPEPAISNVFGVFAFSVDGRYMVTEDENSVATLWELPARRRVHQWATPSFQSLVFTTKSELLLASVNGANEPPCVRRLFLDPSAGSMMQPHQVSTNSFLGIDFPCSAIAVSSDGQVTVTGHTDGTVAFWETYSGRLIHAAVRELSFTDEAFAVEALAFAADGRTVAAARFSSAAVTTWAMPEARKLGSHFFGSGQPVRFAFSPDGRQLATGGQPQGSGIHLWDAALTRPSAHLHGHQDFLFAVAYSPDGRTLASGGRDGLLKLWHLPTGREVGTVQHLPKEAKFAQITFSPDGTWLGVRDTTGTLHLWHALPLAELDAAADAQVVVH